MALWKSVHNSEVSTLVKLGVTTGHISSKENLNPKPSLGSHLNSNVMVDRVGDPPPK